MFNRLSSCSLLIVLLAFGGCERGESPKDDVLRVGILASLTGPGKAWGEATLDTARLIADYHNARGGILVGDRRYPIELLVRDDQLDPAQTVEAVHELIQKEVKFIIGPLGDDSVVAVAPVLDAAGILYVHYGFRSELIRQDSLAVLGMPIPRQTLPVIFDFLSDQDGMHAVMVVATDTREALYQKTIAERLTQLEGFQLKRLSKFDVSEETFRVSQGDPELLAHKVRRITERAPDALLLVGFPPAEFTHLVYLLRRSGFEGKLIAQNAQDPQMLSKLGDLASEVMFAGGTLPVRRHSDNYETLKAR